MEHLQKIWEYNENQFALDLDDAEDLARYESAFKEMESAEKAVPKDGPASELIRAYCKVYISLFEALFGEGSAAKIVGSTTNARLCEDAYRSLLDYVYAQKDAAALRRQSMQSRYAPVNRRR